MSLKFWAKAAGMTSCLYLLSVFPLKAQEPFKQTDTISLGLKQAEKLFLEKNLSLLARHYQVNADQALADQARLWDNPELITDQNIYANNRFFQHSRNTDGTYNGQYFLQVEQLIKTAGKRGKLIKLARTNAEISQVEFNDLMRNLKLRLRTGFYKLDQLLKIQDLYEMELRQLEPLLKVMKTQLDLGNIARKDLLRIQALEISTRQEAAENMQEISDLQAALRTLLQVRGDRFIRPVQEAAPKPAAVPAFGDLVVTAKEQNPHFKLQQLQVKFQQENLNYQKALAVPDITLAPNFDKNSSYSENYFGLGISLPLPVFNRNQGTVRSARWQLRQEETNLQQAGQSLENDLFSAWNKYRYLATEASRQAEDFYQDYETLFSNIAESYRQRQISLMEFVDFFSTYKEIRQKQLTQKLNLQLAKEEINYHTATDLIP